jgi:hypothetical protein
MARFTEKSAMNCRKAGSPLAAASPDISPIETMLPRFRTDICPVKRSLRNERI